MSRTGSGEQGHQHRHQNTTSASEGDSNPSSSAHGPRTALQQHCSNDTAFVAACTRLNLPTDVMKPPKTGGARRKQQRIYERVVTLYQRQLPEIQIPQMVRLAQLAGIEMRPGVSAGLDSFDVLPRGAR